MDTKEFKLKLYRTSYRMNRDLIDLYKRLGLPYHNFYALLHAVIARTQKLRQDKDYLVLLVSLWCPIQHILGTFKQYAFFSYDMDMELFRNLKPKEYRCLIESLHKAEAFHLDSCESSLNLPIRFQGYYELLNQQRNMGIAYAEWAELYNEHRLDMAADLKRLTSEDDYEPMDSEILKELLLIFKEYVKNLMVESKNRSKYSPILKRVSKYIRGLQEEEHDIDSEESDDIIGTVFEHILINATRCDFLRPIGPAYIYSIFKKRLVKIGNPSTANINLMLVENSAEDNFPYNETVHDSCPTVADEAQIYLFDELCELWTKYDLGDIALSRFLFERITPFYLDFLLSDTNMAPDESRITHQYVSYPVTQFSSEFLQRAEGAISQVLRGAPEWFELPISNEDWTYYMQATKKSGKSAKVPSKGLNKQIESYEKAIIDALCEGGDPSVDYRQHFYAICKVSSQDRWIKDYREIFWLNKMGFGGCAKSLEWKLTRDNFFLKFCIRYAHELEADEDKYTMMEFTPKAIHAVCFRQLYQASSHELLQFSKKVLFQSYTEEQYRQLLLFRGDSPIQIDSCTTAPASDI